MSKGIAEDWSSSKKNMEYFLLFFVCSLLTTSLLVGANHVYDESSSFSLPAYVSITHTLIQNFINLLGVLLQVELVQHKQ